MQGLLSNELLSRSNLFGNNSGSNIKSIQKGTATLLTTPTDITVASINKNSSVVRIFVTGGNDPSQSLVAATLTSDTNLRLETGATPGGIPIVYWEVIEFNNVKSKQSGAVAEGADVNVNISHVDTNKSLLFFSYLDTSTGAQYMSYNMVRGQITSSTNINFKRGATSLKTIYWQVIEFN